MWTCLAISKTSPKVETAECATRRSAGLRSVFDRGLDAGMRFVDRDKNVIRIVEAEGSEISEHVVEVWHGERDLRKFGRSVERRLAHVKTVACAARPRCRAL